MAKLSKDASNIKGDVTPKEGEAAAAAAAAKGFNKRFDDIQDPVKRAKARARARAAKDDAKAARILAATAVTGVEFTAEEGALKAGADENLAVDDEEVVAEIS